MTGGIYHVPEGVPYHRENSIRGVNAAAKAHADEIDLDIWRTKPNPRCRICKRRKVKCVGHDVGCHWRRPLLHDQFRDPLRRIKEDACIDDLTWEQVSRLVAPRMYRIRLVETLLRRCAKVGIGGRLEPKGHPVYNTDAPWQGFAQMGDDFGCEVRMYALRNSPHPGYGESVVPVARRNGVPGKVIH